MEVLTVSITSSMLNICSDVGLFMVVWILSNIADVSTRREKRAKGVFLSWSGSCVGHRAGFRKLCSHSVRGRVREESGPDSAAMYLERKR